MMGVLKSTTGLLLVLIVAVVHSEHSEVELACAKEFNLDIGTAYAELGSNKTLSEELMCFAKCFLDKNDMLEADGTVKKEKIFELMFHSEKQRASEELQKEFEEALTGCNKQFDKENCELAGNVYRCMMANLKTKPEE